MNRCSVALGCPAARPGPAPQRRSPDERQDNGYMTLGSCGHLWAAEALTCANGRRAGPSGSATFTPIPRCSPLDLVRLWCGLLRTWCRWAPATSCFGGTDSRAPKPPVTGSGRHTGAQVGQLRGPYPSSLKGPVDQGEVNAFRNAHELLGACCPVERHSG